VSSLRKKCNPPSPPPPNGSPQLWGFPGPPPSLFSGSDATVLDFPAPRFRRLSSQAFVAVNGVFPARGEEALVPSSRCAFSRRTGSLRAARCSTAGAPFRRWARLTCPGRLLEAPPGRVFSAVVLTLDFPATFCLSPPSSGVGDWLSSLSRVFFCLPPQYCVYRIESRSHGASFCVSLRLPGVLW